MNTGAMAHTHHEIDYVELTVPELPPATDFYAKAFGWGLTDYGGQYAGIQGGADEQGGGFGRILGGGRSAADAG